MEIAPHPTSVHAGFDMPSHAFEIWNDSRAVKLDYMEDVHRRIGGGRRGRRFTTEQVNHLYVVILSAEFQGFCRDLHDECSDHWATSITNPSMRVVTRDLFLSGRKLNRGNPNPSNVGSDFGRFGLKLWDEVRSRYSHGNKWHDRLKVLVGWINAIAHQNFDPRNLGGLSSLTLAQVREWRRTCRGLSAAFDAILKDHLTAVTGSAPW